MNRREKGEKGYNSGEAGKDNAVQRQTCSTTVGHLQQDCSSHMYCTVLYLYPSVPASARSNEWNNENMFQNDACIFVFPLNCFAMLVFVCTCPLAPFPLHNDVAK